MLEIPLILKGAMISGSLIMAIGAQNAYVLKQGLLRQHVFWVCLVCFVCDAMLIAIGVLGLGALISQSAVLSNVLAVAGVLFLLGYGLRSFYSAFRSTHALQAEASTTSAPASLRSTILTTLALTLLNPHVYLDTMVIIGGIAGTLPALGKWSFLLGATLSSLCWFFGLGYGARLLRPIFQKPISWRVLEFFIGCLMLSIAWGLLRYLWIQ